LPQLIDYNDYNYNYYNEDDDNYGTAYLLSLFISNNYDADNENYDNNDIL